MKHFSEMPEAVDYIASQAWLSPDEPAARIVRYTPGKGAKRPIGPRQAVREIAGILRRTTLSTRHLN